MNRILLLVCLCLGWASAQAQVALPPRRATFAAKAPTRIQLGKLWWDIGLFHPFTGEVSRDQWEKGFFKLMNQSTQPGADVEALAAEALALLKDPASLLLEQGEGRGSWVLPIIWEVRHGKAWIIGGDKEQLSAPFGPVDQINGRPIGEFLGRRLGSYQSDDRIFAALTLAGRRGGAFRADFRNGGKVLQIQAVEGLGGIKSPWIKGGWKSRPVHTLRGETFKDLKALTRLPRLDFRAAVWLDPTSLGEIENALVFLGAQSAPREVVRLMREHRGQYDEDWERYAHDSGFFNRMSAVASPNRIAYLTGSAPTSVTLPQVVLDSRVAELLAGWGLPAGMNASAREATYAFVPGVEVRLRMESWARSLASAKHQATFQNGHILTKQAAKALAAASIINYDHLFGFTPEGMQAEVFRAAVEAEAKAADTQTLVLRAGGITKDAHVGTSNSALFPSPLQRVTRGVLGDQAESQVLAPNLSAYLGTDGKVRLLRTLQGPTHAGSIIESMNGVDVAQEVQKVRPFSSGRADVKDALFDFGQLGLGESFGRPIWVEDPKKLLVTEIVFRDPKSGAARKVPLPNNGSDFMYVPLPPPPGWELSKMDDEAPTVQELTKALEAGKHIIIDARQHSLLDLKGGWRLPEPHRTPSHSSFRRTPHAPFAWGTDPYEDSVWLTQPEATFAVRGYAQPTPRSEPKALPGSLVILVAGTSISELEIHPLFLREAFPLNTKIVGLPTGGTMGATTWIALPQGGDNALQVYTPTGTWLTINGKNYSYTGLPLDRQITEAELMQEMEAGSPDPLMSAAFKALGIK